LVGGYVEKSLTRVVNIAVLQLLQ